MKDMRYIRNHLFNIWAKISKKLTFLPPDTHIYVCISGGKKCEFFVKFCTRIK